MSKRVRSAITWARRGLAGVLLFSLVALIGASYVGPARVCRQELTAAGTTVQLCGPAGLDDVPAIGVGLLAVLILFLPDLSELSIANIATLKPRVEQAEKKAEDAQQKATQLEFQLQQLAINQQVAVNVYPPDIHESLQRVEAALANLRGARVPRKLVSAEPPPPKAMPPSQRRALLEARMLRVASEMERSLPNFQRPQMLAWETQPSKGAIEWLNRFGPQILDFRQMRNAVVHRGETVSDDQLQAAVQLGESLLAGLREIEQQQG